MGSIGVIWSLLWALLVFESPSEHPRISKVHTYSTSLCDNIPVSIFFKAESAYVKANTKVRKSISGRNFPPLKEVFLSTPFLALMVTHVGANWGLYTLLTGTPLFLNNIHHYSLMSVS